MLLTDDCDFTGDDYQYQMHFTSEEQLTKYMKIKYGEKVLDRLKGRAKPKRKARSA